MLKNLSVAMAAALILGTALVPVGCSSSEPGAAQQSAESGTNASLDWKTGLDAEVVTALSELSEADRTAALDQKICPVSEKPLGSMGAPIKVAVDGQEVFVCCEACVATVKENPDEYLAKLKKE